MKYPAVVFELCACDYSRISLASVMPTRTWLLKRPNFVVAANYFLGPRKYSLRKVCGTRDSLMVFLSEKPVNSRSNCKCDYSRNVHTIVDD